jgi:glycerophosphoryl diester phosphodiesterase
VYPISILSIGHRGACGYETENTLESFAKAVELKVDMVELDVYGCLTGEAIVFHDLKLERLAGVKGRINRLTLSQIKDLRIGKDQQIPVLSEVLDVIGRKAKVNVELKGNTSLVPALRTIERYVHEKGWEYEDFIFSSFSHRLLKKAFIMKPQVPRAVLASYFTARLFVFAKKIKAENIHVEKRLVHLKLVDDAHKMGLKVFVWTVNDPEDIKKMKAMGVDGVFSDFPERVKT